MPVFRHTRTHYPRPPQPSRKIAEIPIRPKVEPSPHRNVRPVEAKLTRTDTPRPILTDNGVVNSINNVIEGNEKKVFDYYLGFGGMGDAMLVLATAYKNPNSNVIFFGNEGSIPLIRDFFRIFKVPATVMANIMGRPVANVVFDRIKKLATFKESAHLADGLYYEDWRNEEKYIKRIVGSIPEWKHKFGNINKKFVVIAPCGSDKNPGRQRYLSRKEYETLVNKYLSNGYEVYGTGSDSNFREYFFKRERVWWITNRILRNWTGVTKSHDLSEMLKIINSASEVISVDTWLKTYSLIAGIPTTVIATRWNGHYKNYGEDVTDWIFLNKKIWPNIKIAKIEELLN